jgi:hypothetical protein
MVSVRTGNPGRMNLDGILEWNEFLNIPEPEYLWGTLVRLRAVNIFQGWPQSAKSFVALHLAMAVADGRKQFLGHPIHEQLEVIYASIEDAEADAARARASEYRDLEGAFRVYRGMLNLTKEAAAQENFFGLLDQLSPGALIVIDSFSAASGVNNENDSADVQKVYNLFFEAARRGFTVIVIAHIAKVADAFTVQASRGSSAAAGAASSIIGFKETSKNRFELQQAKNRTAPERDKIRFETTTAGPVALDPFRAAPKH